MHSTEKYVTHSTVQTELLGEALGRTLHAGEVVALYGAMGMGKTAFTRGIAKGLSCPDIVSSPTFALVHEYPGICPVYHFDMYRVTDMDDLYSTGFFDYLDTEAVLIIEWSENIAQAIPQTAVRVHIARGEQEDDRIFTVENAEGGRLSC